MNLHPHKLLLSSALALGISACASVPPGPPPEVLRLQTQLDRLHADPRIVDNAGPELASADAAVYALSRDARSLDYADLQRGVDVAEHKMELAEATALARYEERRNAQIAIDRERVASTERVIVATEPATVVTQPARVVTSGTAEVVSTANGPTRIVRTDDGRIVATEPARVVTVPARVVTTTEPARVVVAGDQAMPQGRAELLALQSQLPGMESRLDVRGLVVRLGDFQFEPNRATLMPAAERSLDTLAVALRDNPNTDVSIETYAGINDANLGAQRARAVSDYLDARGIDPSRVDARAMPIAPAAGVVADRHVDVVIRRN